MDEELHEEVEEGAAWMATFADLSTLLLTFFVLLLSFANLDVKNFRMALGSVRDALGVQFRHRGDVKGLATSVVELSKEESTPNFKKLKVEIVRKMETVIEENGFEAEIEAMVSDIGVIVRVRDQALFGPGSDELHEDSERLMAVIVELCETIPMPIWVEGHTDNTPINTRRFPSNWELSASRAAAAMRYLTETGNVPAERIRVGGYADTRPVANNGTLEGRALNRRVEFVFLTPPEPAEDTAFADASGGRGEPPAGPPPLAPPEIPAEGQG
jgi:chemotaxis protein MotB